MENGTLDYPELFLENVKRYMTIRGISMRHGGKLCGISPQTFSNLMAGAVKPTLKTMSAISGGLNVPLPILLSEGLPDDMLSSSRLIKLLGFYVSSTKDGREIIYNIARHEAEKR